MILSIIITAVLAAAGFAGITIERKREGCCVFSFGIDWITYAFIIPILFATTLAISCIISDSKSFTYDEVKYDKEIVSIELADNQYKCVVNENDFTKIIFIKTNDATLGERNDYKPFVVCFEEKKSNNWFFGTGEYYTGNVRYEIYLNSGGIDELLGG